MISNNSELDAVDFYFADMNDTMDKLDYWKIAKLRLHILSKMSFDYLLPLASSAPFERLFSRKQRAICNARRIYGRLRID